MKDEVKEYVRGEISNLLRQKKGIEIMEMNVQSDHIHLIMWIPPKYEVFQVMGYLKGKLAIWLLQKYERLGRQFWGRGYCVSTVGIDEQRISEYLKWQENKERKSRNCRAIYSAMDKASR